MRKATFNLLNLELDKLDYLKDMLDNEVAKKKISDHVKTLRTLINDDFIMNPANRNASKVSRTNFVKNNPGLLDAANLLLKQPLKTPLFMSQLCDEKHLRVLITYVRDRMPDFKYYTYPSGGDRMIVKTAGTLIETGEEHYDPNF